MDENAQKLREALDQLASMLESTESRLPLYNSDGSVNYRNVMTLLKDPAFSEYRKQNPQVVQAAKSMQINDLGLAGIKVAGDIGKLAFSLDQIRRGNKVDDTPPRFPDRPQRSVNLQRAISRAQRGANEGMSASERSSLENQANQTFRVSQQLGTEASGGQSSSAQANIQLAANNRNRQALQNAIVNQRVRGQQQQGLNSLLGLEQNENQRLQNFDLAQYRYRDFPLWQARSTAKERLLNAGYTNAFNAGDQIFRDMSQLSQLYRSDMPGYIPPNSGYQKDEGALDGVLNNPVRYMKTNLPTYMKAFAPFVPGYGQSPNPNPDPNTPHPLEVAGRQIINQAQQYVGPQTVDQTWPPYAEYR